MEYNYLAILLTENCNAKCKMCCDCRGEVKGYTLTYSELNTILSKVKGYKNIGTIGITGGEPMLYPELCEYIFNYNYDRNMKFTLKTNGFWGRNITSAREFITNNKDKISMISFSYDEFHKEFIDINYIKNIIDISIEFKIETEVVGCFLSNSMKPGDILNEFGEYAYLTKFLYQPVIETGGAKKLDNAEFVKLIDTDKCDIICPLSAIPSKSILINPKLDVFPCCSQCVENTILNMGNLNNNELIEIIEDIKYNKVLHTLLTKGFTPFIKFMKENNIKYPKRISNHCEMCEYLFKNDWFLKILKEKNYYDNL